MPLLHPLINSNPLPLAMAMPFFHLLLFTTLPMAIDAFEALPFVQIDAQFYMRLAQCQAKCSENMPTGSQSELKMLEAATLLELCHQGCLDSDSPITSSAVGRRQQQPQSPQQLAFAQGQQLFHSVQQQEQKSAAGDVPLALGVRPLCVQRMLNSGPHERLEALVAVDLSELGQKAMADGRGRLLVKWRSTRRRKSGGGRFRRLEERKKTEQDGELEAEEQESQWITASIEPGPLFQVSSLRPGLSHQFWVQPVFGLGAQGPAAQSDWFDFDQLASQDGPLEGGSQLQFFSQYNAEHGVAAWVRWRHDEKTEQQQRAEVAPKPVLNQRLHRNASSSSSIESAPFSPEPFGVSHQPSSIRTTKPPPAPASVVFPTCRLQIEWANKSSRAVQQLNLDGSDGFLLRHLAFGSDYSVRLVASQPEEQQKLQLPAVALLEGTFLSMHCAQVFGPGSLECEPEQVRHLAVHVFADNGTALVSWERPEAVANILLYELTVEPIGQRPSIGTTGGDISDIDGCHEFGPRARVVSADANSALLASLPQNAVCHFELRLTVYDLLGRDASASTSFRVVPAGLRPGPAAAAWQLLAHLDGSMLALLLVLVLVPVAALITLVCTFSRQGGRRKREQRAPAANSSLGPGGGKKKEEQKRKEAAKKKKKMDEKGEEERKKTKKPGIVRQLLMRNGNAAPNGQTPLDEATVAQWKMQEEGPVKERGRGQSSSSADECNSPQSSAGTQVTTLPPPHHQRRAESQSTTEEDEEQLHGQQQQEKTAVTQSDYRGHFFGSSSSRRWRGISGINAADAIII